MSKSRWHPLEAKTATAGNNSIIDLEAPANRRVAAFMLRIVATISNTTGSTYGVSSRALAQLLDKMVIDHPIFSMRATGRMMWNMYHYMTGKQLAFDRVNITTGNTGSLEAFIKIPVIDPAAAFPLDTAVPTELFKETKLYLDYKSAFTLGVANLEATSVSVKPYVQLLPGAGAIVPMRSRYDFQDWNQATVKLGRLGCMSHLFRYDNSDMSVTTAQLGSVTLRAGEEVVIDNMPSELLHADWNDQRARGSSYGDLGDTQNAGFTTEDEAEQIDTTAPFNPVLCARDGYKVAELEEAHNNDWRLDYTGTDSATRFAYRIVGGREEDAERFAADKFGFQGPVNFEVKTGSKVELAGPSSKVNKLRRSLPLRIAA